MSELKEEESFGDQELKQLKNVADQLQKQKKSLEDKLSLAIQNQQIFQKDKKEIQAIIQQLTKENQESLIVSKQKNKTIDDLNNQIFKMQYEFNRNKRIEEEFKERQSKQELQEEGNQEKRAEQAKKNEEFNQKERKYKHNIQKMSEMIDVDKKEIIDLSEHVQTLQKTITERDLKLKQANNLNLVLTEQLNEEPQISDCQIQDEQKKNNIMKISKIELLRNKDVGRTCTSIQAKLKEAYGGKWNVLIQHQGVQSVNFFTLQNQNFISFTLSFLKFTIWEA